MSIFDAILQNTGTSDVNEWNGNESQSEDGVISPLTEKLSLKIKDEELITISQKWISDWNKYEAKVKDKQKLAEDYWKGKQKGSTYEDKNHETVDNVIFKSLETFLPQATKANPEPYTYVRRKNMPTDDNLIEIDRFKKHVKELLADQADVDNLRLALKSCTRFWSIYLLGVIKLGYGENGTYTRNVKTKDIILDPDATIEDGEYTGKYIGEKVKLEASKLIERFPEHKKMILADVKKKTGTMVSYIEWWTNDYFFITYKDTVLGKYLNPHYNYEEEIETVDEFGETFTEVSEPKNHFPSPKHPYVFLSVFNIGEHPYDDTSLILQNIGLQDIINKRLKQIDRNADSQNNGIVLSGEVFDKKQASEAARTLADGGFLLVPGDITNSYRRDQAPSLTPDVYNQLIDLRSETANIFGTTGLSPTGLSNERTARGKIITQQADTSRIGGGVTEYIEQVADKVFNYWYQLMLVYEPEVFDGYEIVPIIISVKEGSLMPKDDMTKRDEAIDLWAQNAIDPLTFAERLDIPDPEEYVKRLITWQTNPQALVQQNEQTQATAPQITPETIISPNQ